MVILASFSGRTTSQNALPSIAGIHGLGEDVQQFGWFNAVIGRRRASGVLRQERMPALLLPACSKMRP